MNIVHARSVTGAWVPQIWKPRLKSVTSEHEVRALQLDWPSETDTLKINLPRDQEGYNGPRPSNGVGPVLTPQHLCELTDTQIPNSARGWREGGRKSEQNVDPSLRNRGITALSNWCVCFEKTNICAPLSWFKNIEGGARDYWGICCRWRRKLMERPEALSITWCVFWEYRSSEHCWCSRRGYIYAA